MKSDEVSPKRILFEPLLKNGHERPSVNGLQPRYGTDHRYVSVALDRGAIFPILFSNHHNTSQRQLRLAERKDAKQGVIDCAKGRSRR